MSGELTFSGWQSCEDRKPLACGQHPISEHFYTMYHGTKLAHANSVITNGFKPSIGGLLGPGIYVSRNIKKALCYPIGADRRDKVVFKLKVRVGKVKKIDHDNDPLQKTWKQHGYDCAWVPPHCNLSAIKSGREEDCVWDPKRISVIDVAFCDDVTKREELRRLIRRQRGSGTCELCSVADPHDVQRCWRCSETICPFQSKHVCDHD